MEKTLNEGIIEDEEYLLLKKDGSVINGEAFGQIVAHGLKTPLLTITGYLNLLAEELSGKLSGEEREILDRVVARSKEVLSMIEDLKSYFFLDQSRNGYEESQINPLIDKVIESLKCKTDGAPVRFKVQKEIPSVIACPAELYQVFYNLLENAVKFGADEIELSYKRGQHTHRFMIKDNGWGIESYFVSKIFNIFSRSPRAKKDRGGTGMGLAIVKRLIERHNGKIWVESTVGQGSIFMFELPVNPSLDYSRIIRANCGLEGSEARCV